MTTGIFAYEAANSIQVVTDGTSNTIAFAETLSGEPGPNFSDRVPGRLDRQHRLLQSLQLSDVNSLGVNAVPYRHQRFPVVHDQVDDLRRHKMAGPAALGERRDGLLDV